MGNCREELLKVFYKLEYKDNKVSVDKSKDKPLRFDITQLNPKDLIGFINKSNESVGVIKDLVGKAFYKKVGFLQSKGVENVPQFLKILSDKETVVPRAIALENLLSAIKGESDKIGNYDLSLNKVSNNGATPNIPVRRIAAVIGRKWAYQQGFRFKSNPGSTRTPTQIEVMYHKLGMSVLEDLANEGIISLEDGKYVNDFVEGSDTTTGVMRKKYYKDGKIVSLNIEKLVTDNDKFKDFNSLYFTHNALARELAYKYKEEEGITPQLDVIASILGVTNKLTTPSTIVEPDVNLTDAQLDEKLERDLEDDYNVPTEMLSLAREIITKTSSKLSRGNHEFIKQLSEEFNKTGLDQGFDEWAMNQVNGNTDTLNNIFGLNDLKSVLEQKESQTGQNLSNSSPMEDLLIKYSSYLNPDGTPANLHFKYNFVRNARLHNMSSILNAQTSKFSRHGMTTGEVTFDITTPKGIAIYKHMVSELADESGFSVEQITESSPEIDGYIEAYKVLFNKPSSLDQKIGFLKRVITKNPQFQGLPTTVLSSLAAIVDIREGLETGSITTEYATKSDAKASGGMITLMEALGTNPKVKEVLQRMSILNKEKGMTALNDVYGILQEAIYKFIEDVKVDEDGEFSVASLTAGDRNEEFGPVLQKLLDSGIYNKVNKKGEVYTDIRELSKDPTMTLIYGQGEKAATKTIAEGIADKLFISIQKDSKASNPAQKYISELLGREFKNFDELLTDPAIFTDVVEALKTGNKSPANILYKTLNKDVSKALFAERNELLSEVFNVLGDIQKKVGGHIKIMTPAAALDPNIDFNKKNLDNFGIPLEKILDVMKDFVSESGETFEVATREERLTKTTLQANAVHSKDTYNLYSAITDVIQEIGTKKGVIPVHDEVITDPVTGQAIKQEYVVRFKEMARDYDILDYALKTAELLDPDNKSIPKLRAQIDAVIKEKQSIIDNDFNDLTESIFGQSVSNIKDPVIGKKPTPPKPKKLKPAPEESVETEVTPEVVKEVNTDITPFGFDNSTPNASSGLNVTTVLDSLKETNPELSEKIKEIESFIEKSTDITFEDGGIFTYSAADGKGLIKFDTKDKGKDFVEKLLHEIEHAETVTYISNNMDSPEIKYIDRALTQLVDKIWKEKGKYITLQDRLVMYADGKVDSIERMAEAVAILKTETAVQEELNQLLSPVVVSKLKDFINKIYDSFKGFITGKDLQNLETNGVDINTLFKAVNIISTKGRVDTSPRVDTGRLNYDNTKVDKSALGKAEKFINDKVTSLNDAVYSMLLGKIESKSMSTLERVHNKLKDNFPTYVDISNKVNGIYNSSTALQQLLQFMHLSKLNNKQAKNKILSISNKLHQDRTTRDNDIMSKIDDLTFEFTENQKEDLYNFINKVPLADYFLYSFNNTTEASINDRITELDKSMTIKEKMYVDHFVQLYTHNKVLHSKFGYNLDSEYSAGNPKYKDMKELIALKGLKDLGLDKFEEMQANNEELFNIIKDNSVALSMIHKDINDGSSFRNDVKGSLIGEYYEKHMQKKLITEAELDRFGYEEGAGWRVITRPTANTLGLVVRDVDDVLYLEGAGIDLGTTSNDIIISKSQVQDLDLNKNNIITLKDGSFKRVLTDDEKTKMNIIRKPGHSLIHTTSHMIAAQEATILRNEMLKEDIRITLDSLDGDNINILQTLIKDKDSDHHWFIKLGTNVKYIDLPDDIKAKYKPINAKLSDIKGFKDEISLVRKDMAHWLTGDTKQLFQDSPKLQKASKVAKQLISGAKIGMAVVNPVKLAMDTQSNIAFLTTMGVPLSMQLEEGRKIMADMDTLGKLRTNIAQTRVKQVAYPNDINIQNKYSRLLEELEAHPLNGVVQRGFMNSLSSDIYNNNISSLKGLQADINTGLKYLLTKKDGSANVVNKYISDIANVTGDGTEALRYIGNITKKAESGKELASLLDGAADRISKIKDKKDSIAYLNNFIISPNSEFVKAGVWYNDMIDTVAKETYYRYLVNSRNMDPKEAEVLVIESFPDYKENMPMAMKIISDYGVLMFPSYWSRIHVPAYRMLTKRSVNSALGMELSNLTGTHFETILNATLPVRLNEGMNIVHTPLDIVGLNSIFPTQLFK